MLENNEFETYYIKNEYVEQSLMAGKIDPSQARKIDKMKPEEIKRYLNATIFVNEEIKRREKQWNISQEQIDEIMNMDVLIAQTIILDLQPRMNPKMQNLYYHNTSPEKEQWFVDNEISRRQKSGKITADQISEFRNMDIVQAAIQLRAMNYIDSQTDKMKKDGTLSEQEEQAIRGMPLVEWQNFLLALEFRNKELQKSEQLWIITKKLKKKIMSFDPFFWEKYLQALNAKHEGIERLKKSGELSEEELSIIRSMNPFDAQQYLSLPVKETTEKLKLLESTQKELGELKQETVWQKIEKSSSHQEYKIKHWDTLRNIVKKHYWLKNHKQIANYINTVVAYNLQNNHAKYLTIDNVPKWWDFIRWDVLKVNKKIYLPSHEYFEK